MQIRLHPAYSKNADPSAIPPEVARCLDPSWHLSQHQLDTYHALCSPNTDVVINTAMTGDGKSLAGLLPFLTEKRPTLALYPTNELIRDQKASASDHMERCNIGSNLMTDLYGEKLATTEYTHRGDAIEHFFQNQRLILSNPDILHYILQFCYTHPGRAADWLAGKVRMLFDQITFDEFHIFEMPQIGAVLSGLLFLNNQRPLKTLFLSATPGGELVQRLQKAGLRTTQVMGLYHHGNNPGPGWRRILHGCDLTFDKLRAEEWVKAHLDDIVLPFFRQHRPGAKGAIIVNSIASAHRIVAYLRPHFQAEGLTVLPNTGITDRTDRQDSYHADLLVGTSTVDVGVDFQINFLVFDASSSGHFLQRLGRLGRHDHYTRDGTDYPFHTYAAYALVPDFVYERLFVGRQQTLPLLEPGIPITRDVLKDVMAQAFPAPTTFPRYLERWGRFQPAQVITALREKKIRANYAEFSKKLTNIYEQTLGVKITKTIKEAFAYEDEGKKELLNEARSFRGGSPLMCAVLKPREQDSSQESAETYDLFSLLANGELELLDEESFFRAARLEPPRAEVLRRANPVAWFRLRTWNSQRNTVEVRLLAGTDVEHITVLDGGITVTITNTGVPWSLNTLNRSLSKRKVVALVVPGEKPQELRRRLRLPFTFALHPYTDTSNISGTIAFARQALLLDTMLFNRRAGSGDAQPPIVL